MDDVTPNQDRIAGRFDQPRQMAGRVPRQGHRRHAGKRSTITDRPDALSIGSNRSPRLREECLRRLGRARARIFVVEEAQIGLVDNKLRTRKDRLPLSVGQPVPLSSGCKPGNEDGVDVQAARWRHPQPDCRRHLPRVRAHGSDASLIDQRKTAVELEQKRIHGHARRYDAESRALDPFAFAMIEAGDDIEIRLVDSVVDRGHDEIAKAKMI